MVTRLLLISILSLVSANCWADAYYWIDEDGKRQYSDRVPPKDSKHERQIINKRGYTVDTLPRQKTQSELDAEAKAQAEAEKQQYLERKRRAESAAYDTLLITTYESVADIEHARDDRLGLLDASILVEEEARADNSRRLTALIEQEQALLDQGKPISDKLRRNIATTKERISTNERNITELKRQRGEIEAKYNRDIKRYLELSSASN